jgi:hypothetical protein
VLEVRLTRSPRTLTLRYGPGLPELLGVGLSLAALGGWAVAAWAETA